MIYKFIPSNITLDRAQTQIANQLEVIAKNFDKKSGLLSFFQKPGSGKNLPAGIYLYGNIGSGKTMLMKAFFDRVEGQKEIVHYQNFMRSIHIRSHRLQELEKQEIIRILAYDIAKRIKVLCIDEFDINDISDAMIILRLFKYLLSKKVFIFLTTNAAPDTLYKDGIGRESFLPFIAMIKQIFALFSLDSMVDYRFLGLSSGKRILYPINNDNKKEINRIINNLQSGGTLLPTKIEVFGREISLKRTHKKLLFTDFDELFERELGYVDYVEICRFFELIVLENIREISESESNIITRFINFIDNAYFYKVILFVTLTKSPAEIYTKGPKLDKFKRAVSRLNEMNTEDYLILGNQGIKGEII